MEHKWLVTIEQENGILKKLEEMEFWFHNSTDAVRFYKFCLDRKISVVLKPTYSPYTHPIIHPSSGLTDLETEYNIKKANKEYKEERKL